MRRRTNFFLGLVLLAAAIGLMLRALNLIPDGIFDLVVRAWPVLLVFGGLMIFLRERVRLGGVIALVLSGILVAGVVSYAFSTRATQERDDYQQALSMPMSAGVTLLRVQVDTLNTDVELVRAIGTGQITGQFVGSTESKLEAEYNEAGDSTATLVVSEKQPNTYPLLAAVGRGRLTLELPPEVGLDISFKGADGDASLNLSGLAVERLNMDLRQGDALVTLPEYDPQASAENDVLGVLAARNGDVTVMIPAIVGARLELSNGSGQSPLYDANVYNLLANGVLEARNYDTFPIKLRYVIEAPRGLVSLEVVEPGT
ncbi:MAG TPA: hypothetical protein VHO69_12645 [Phototrophicaceae bacterium]|nr:hypothetical protein [Phototrophicaceae bacterium]